MCKKYVCTSDEWKKENKKYSNKFEIWSKIFGDDIQNIKDLFKIGDNLNARQKSGVPFPKGLTDDDARTIIYLSDWMAVQVFKPKQMGNFLGNEFLLKLKDDMQKAIEKKQQFKYILYFGHDSSILTIMSALGVPLELALPILLISILNFIIMMVCIVSRSFSTENL